MVIHHLNNKNIFQPPIIKTKENMSALLLISKYIDALNEKIGLTISWALLAAVLICSGNALIRYTFNTSSNAWLEIQWYLFSAIFLLASSYTLRRNEHVRIDVIVGKFSKRTQVWIDVFGFTFFLLPTTLLILYFATPYAFESLRNQEVSSNAGGLIVWPAKLLIPVGFFLLTLQGISELIKRLGYLVGKVELSAFEKETVTPEDEIQAIKAANQL
jgi:TRAP-type mannitol/chloroaromatic compound transport system permease small subunit